MADHAAEHESADKSLTEKIADKIRGHESSSSPDADDDKPTTFDAVKSKVFRLFGREKPVHKVLGGGKRNVILHLCLNTSECGSMDLCVYVMICLADEKIEDMCDYCSFVICCPYNS